MKRKFTPILTAFLALCSASSFAQGGLPGNTRPIGGNPLGWTGGSAGSLEIRNNFVGQPIHFFTGGAAAQRMTILGTNGFVGIGTAAPNQRLTVQSGNINLFTANQAYMINSRPVLWHNNITSSIFVGDGTGNAGTDNTFVGSLAGAANIAGTTAQDNTFVGARAGQNCASGLGNVSIGNENGAKLSGNSNFNTFVGAGNASNASNSLRNVVVGHNAMQFAPNAVRNTIIGDRAYFLPTSIGVGNVIMGSEASSILNATAGDNNILIGNRVNIIGGATAPLNDDNILIGAEAGASLPTGVTVLNNAIAIGANAEVRGSNRMILGNNSMNVGIGLSNDNVFNGPRNRLEINTGSQTSNPALAASGLMFRDLTSASPTLLTNPGPGVLGVDVNGNVIYVPASAGSTTPGNLCSAAVKNPLTASWEIPLANNNYLFSETAAGTGKVGIGDITTACTPGNVLEVAKNGTTPNASGISGLRLTDLKSGAGTGTANGNVLSVTTNGDVILVPDQLGVPDAQNGTNTLNTFGTNPNGKVELGGLLLHDTKVSTGNTNFEVDYASGGNISLGENPNIFAGTANQANIALGQTNVADATANGNIMLGNGIHAFPGAQDNRSIGLRNNLYGTGNYVFGEDNTVGLFDQLYSNMIMGHHNSVDGQTNSAIGRFNRIQAVGLSYAHGNDNYIQGSNAFTYGNYVVNNRGYRISIGNSFDPVAQNALITFLGPDPASTGTDNIAHLDPTIDAYQIIPAININTSNYIGVKKYEPIVALDVWGSIHMSGNLVLTSDSTLKTNIHRININATNTLNRFRPVTYEWIHKVDTAMYGTKYGFTAQQIESVMPDLVFTENNGIKHVDYNAVIPLLVKALQEQSAKIDSLTNSANNKDSIQDAQIQQLMNMINACCQSPGNRGTSNTPASSVAEVNVELSDKDAIVLNQNVPNPFAEQTTIAYNIPEKTGFAQILFSDMKGQIIKVVDIKTKGKGQLNVFANDLSSGLYSYSLYADGKLIDTKKMVKTD